MRPLIKYRVLIPLVIIALAIGWFLLPYNVAPVSQQTAAASNSQIALDDLCRTAAAPTQDEIAYNRDIAKDPFVQYLRTAIVANLAGTYSAGKYPGLVDGIHTKDSAADALSKIGAEYLNSKFIVLGTDVAPGGGESIDLIFKDKPDQVFYTWVYAYTNAPGEVSGYDLRGFMPKNDGPDIATTEQQYAGQICSSNIGV